MRDKGQLSTHNAQRTTAPRGPDADRRRMPLFAQTFATRDRGRKLAPDKDIERCRTLGEN